MRAGRPANVLAVLACVLLQGCGDSVRGDVVRKLRQPGGYLTATMTLDPGGFATSSLSYRVYLQQDGGAVWERLSIYDADKGAPTMHWRDSHTLVVSVSCATVFSYNSDISLYRPGDKPTVNAQLLLETSGMCEFAKR
jgi:hypothetical protein